MANFLLLILGVVTAVLVVNSSIQLDRTRVVASVVSERPSVAFPPIATCPLAPIAPSRPVCDAFCGVTLHERTIAGRVAVARDNARVYGETMLPENVAHVNEDEMQPLRVSCVNTLTSHALCDLVIMHRVEALRLECSYFPGGGCVVVWTHQVPR